MTTTFAAVNTYAYSVTYLADKMLRSLQDIVRDSGLNPAKISDDWVVLERGVRTWLTSRELRSLTLEVYAPEDFSLVGRWDFDLIYSDFSNSDGAMWIDTDAIRYAIRKAGTWPSSCSYRIVVDAADGHVQVEGWGSTMMLSTQGFTRFAVGTSIGTNGAGAGAAYWRRI